TAGRDEVGAEAVRLLEFLDVFFVGVGWVRSRIVVRRDDAEHHVALAGQLVVIGQVARPDDLDVGLVEPALTELARKGPTLLAGEIDESGVRREIADPL